MDAILNRAYELKQALIEFVFQAEGDLAVALESYTADQSRSQQTSTPQQRDLVVDTFLTEGQVGDRTPLDLFLQDRTDLTDPDRQLISSWKRSFLGLFAIEQILEDGFEVMNWLTAKHYRVKPNNEQTRQEMQRFKLGEVLLTRIAPVTSAYWMFSGPCTTLGRLGKPKLAVAIGNFKQNHKSSLYSDAPELLEEAWQSVERYHQEFLDFFGPDEITLPGYQLTQKLSEFQEQLAQRQLDAAGIDRSKTLAEAAAEAGMEEAEMAEVAEAMGVDAQTATKMFQQKDVVKMVTPSIELPPAIKKAEQVTVLAHPRWGQSVLPTYPQFKTFLESEDEENYKSAEKLLRKSLEDPAMNAFVWQRLAQQYPVTLERLVRSALDRPDFVIASDLEALLQEFGKPLAPELPEIASVPLHLHNLFQEALAEVSKSKPKGKDKVKTAKGFMP